MKDDNTGAVALTADAIEEIEKKIGYVFVDKGIIIRAFTHSSYAHEHVLKSYERLEFLGDATLNFVVASILFEKCPWAQEKALTRKRSNLVSQKALSECFDKLDLLKYILCSNGDLRNNLGDTPKIKCDIFESIVGAMVLDNGFNPAIAKAFILENLPIETELRADSNSDPKSRVFEYCDRNKLERGFEIVSQTMLPSPWFTVKLIINGVEVATGEGRRKSDAEQMAAKAYFDKLK